jgi:lysophospholipase L1-like esterase
MVGRRLNREIINLGFSGSGVMDAQMATALADLDPAVFILDCMANMLAADVPIRVQPFIRTIRATHPATPILLVEEYHVGNLQTMRGMLLRKEFDALKAEGDHNLFWMPGAGVLGNDGDGTVDGVHPNDLGMWHQANAFVKSLTPILK